MPPNTETPPETAAGGFTRTKLYDVLAASPLFIWFALGAYGIIPRMRLDLAERFTLANILDLLSGLATLVFFATIITLVFLRRMPVAKSEGPWPRVIAIIGGNLELALGALRHVSLPLPLSMVSTALLLIGTIGSIAVLASLGRSYSVFPEARQLVVSGAYARIRHPLYLAAEISTLGLVMQYAQPWAALLALAAFGFQIWRMHNEERVLSAAFPEYRDYAARTARLIPGLY